MKIKELPWRLISIAVTIFFVTIGIIYINHFSNRLFFAVDKFEIAKNDITIGENSDIVFENVPHNFMIVHFENDSIRWNINNTDSLQYIKINNNNPNKTALTENSVINVNNQFSINYRQIAEITKDWKNTRFSKKDKYFSLRNILARNTIDSIQIDTLPKWKNLKSLISISEDNKISLIILDKYTSLSQNGQTIRYKNFGKVGGSEIKIQFYNVIENIAKFNEIDKKSMFVGDINYFAKPTVKTTSWGAGHIKIKNLQNGHFEITFPKAITLSESYSSLDSMISKSGGEIQIKQYQTAFPTQNDIYIPAFSNALQTEIANVQKHEGQNKIHICYFGTDGTHCKQLTDNFSLFPKIQTYTSDFGNGYKVHFRARNLDGNFYASAFLWIVFVGCICLLVLWLYFREWDFRDEYQNTYSPEKAKNAWKYSGILYSIFIAFMCCKMFVDTKLSYTYPFFEKIYSSVILTATGQLILLAALLLLINFMFAKRFYTKAKSWKKFIPFGLIGFLGIFAVLVWCFLKDYLLINNVAGNIFDSYLPKDSATDFFGTIKQILSWNNKFAMVDNYQNVYYSVFLTITLSVFSLLLFNVILFFKKDKGIGLWTKIKELLRKVVLFFIKDKGLKLCAKFKKWISKPIITQCAITIVIAVILFGVTFLPGNFRAIPVTLLFIVGLSYCWDWTTTYLNEKKWWQFILMSILVLFVIANPARGDVGILINILGVFAFFVIYYAIKKNKETVTKDEADKTAKQRAIITSIIFVTLLILSLVAVNWVLPNMFKTENVNYERYARRSTLFTDFKNVQSTGYRYNESDAEFMIVLSHYMHGDTLKNNDIMSENYQLHPSVSTGQSPVVLNDVSFPAAFYAPLKGATFVFFGLLVALLLLVFWFSIYGFKGFNISEPKLHIRMRWRLLAVCIWVFTSLYIFASYFGFVPFTGRLIPGYGVDAVGEALETVILFTFMGAVAWQLPENKNNK